MSVNWKNAQKKAALTARWAVTMAKVRIRRVASRTRWQLVTFYGEGGAESAGVVDMLAVRKDHAASSGVIRRGDALQIILIKSKVVAPQSQHSSDASQSAGSRYRVSARIPVKTGSKHSQKFSLILNSR